MRILLALLCAVGCASSESTTAWPVGDADRGALVFETCAACHALTADDEEAYFGPHLQAVIGRPLAEDENFGYSEALREAGGTWTDDRLAAYLHAPRLAIPGTSMVQALPDSQEVSDVIAFLRREANSSVR